MSAASKLSGILLEVKNRDAREVLYQKAEREYGKNFADHLRDTVEAHHLILNNERRANG